MPDADHLMLIPDCQILFDYQRVMLEVGERRVSVAGIDPGPARQFLYALDGTTPWHRVAESVGLNGMMAERLVDLLRKQELLKEAVSQPDSLSGAEFARLCRERYRELKAELFTHPLWLALDSGQASQSLFMGWLIENYHYIEGVNARLSMAAACCGDMAIKPFFVKHYVEEWNHSEFFLRSLERLGVTRAQAMASIPLPSTLAILNHMRWAARRDPLYYAACSGFLESTGEDHQGGRRFVETLERSYAAHAPGCLKPVIQHSELDEAYQHNTVVEDVCAQIPRVDLDRASGALDAAEALVETLQLWSSEMIYAYADGPFALREGLCSLTMGALVAEGENHV